MSNPRKMNRAQLVEFTANAATGVANGKVTGFSAAQNTAISDALIAANAILAAKDTAQIETRTLALQATQEAEDAAKDVLDLLGDLKLGMRSVNSPASEHDVIGFDPPDDVRSIVTPQTPTDLVGAAIGTGFNELKFNGNNPNKSVTYVVEAKVGDTLPYVMIGTCTAQRFTHTGVIRGEFYKYHVRAQAARNLVSMWSNEVVVYAI